MNRSLRPASIRPPFSAYSHGIAVPEGSRMVFVSGQLGITPDDVVPADLKRQAELCLENIAAILADDGMALSDVVKFTAFVTDPAMFAIYREVRGRYVPGDSVASTLVMVSALVRPEFKIEVEAIAAKSGG